MTQPIVNVQNLSHVYMQGTPLEHRALDQVSIQVAEGECLAIIGHTGSGKSTLIQHFNGLIRPQSGTVIINGMDVSSPKIDIRTLRRQVGLVFQNPEDQLFEKLVGDDVAYGPFRMGLPLEEVRRRVQWAMDLVGLSFQEMKDRPTFALSGGQKRKVALAGVLSLQPKVLVLDEPTAGLDPRSRLELLDRIRRLNREEKLTVIFVSHNMEEVARLADRVYVMANGKSVCEGTPRQIFGNQELLRQHHIGTPESVDILYRLREQGYSIDPSAFLPEETAMEILKLMNR
ncbi:MULTISPECIES: energy-coupling factor transporter ATPase [Brevibacillus]|uniref:energy-coupling factor transporter ATPase n=1 Tax=Brevibacillus TaxID=55080 RepID=UPI000D0EF917|nr:MULTISPECIES: energy-coupling factor transporter ATPase [Brevibacillus]PSJ70850.1 energy-coupling factor transporter ATPase [Brevibacillus brevis]RED31205.1 energy-coupling factor transport system ATP-binding protein [Brevibacillus brevis]TQK63631.1 energy-coupling factor transport system ATP-binding protein [Brevibacillus sp. AG162]VEF89581.1 Energy-coupling factor transporter ATP-binding protein EcfA2 [Brevibacillus brevis]GEC89981.1 energy-coupling factor transporter ATP-binding protein 